MKRPRPALRVELLFYLTFLVAFALLVGVATSQLALAISPERGVVLVVIFVALEVGIFVLYGRSLVTRLVLRPLARVMDTADAVADGDLEARAPDADTRDFATLAERLNRMTDRRLDAQSQLVRSEKLASIGRLAAGVAHEVGNPLGAIGTYVEVLRRRGADPEVMAGLTRELERVDRIVRSLLDYARPQEDPLVPVDPDKIARAAFELLRAQGAFRNVSADTDVGMHVPEVMGRAHVLEQTLVNLLLNAVDATPPGGSIVIGARRWAYEPGLRQSLGLLLTDAGYTVTAEQDGKRGLERAVAESFDLVLCDVRMPEMDGLTFLRNYRRRGGNALVIVMSAYGGEDAAIAAMQEGAYDYLPKPFRPDEVVLTLRKAEERERLRQEVAGLRAQLAAGPAERGLVVASAAMRQALALVAR